MKELDNGDLIFHKTEIPNQPITGYKQSHGNPCIFRKQYEPCKHRSSLQIKLPCGRIQDKETCTIIGGIISPRTCANCNKREI